MPQEKRSLEKRKNKKQIPSNAVISPIIVPEKTLRQKAKPILKEFSQVPIMSEENLKAFLSAVTLGLVKDKFDLEASLDTRIKSAQILQSINEKTNQASRDDEELEEISYSKTLSEELTKRRIEGVDD